MAAAPQSGLGRASRLGPLIAAIVALGLTGCATGTVGAAPTSASPTPEPTVVVTEGEPVTGTGPTEMAGAPLTIPEGAQSVTIVFECEGPGETVVELGDSMRLEQAVLHGPCDGARELSWPLTDETEPVLSVMIPEGVAWTATPTYSTAPFVYDEAVTEDCATFADLYSALMNADSGYTNYDAFGQDEWTERVDDAVGHLAELAVTAAPALADAVAGVHATVSGPEREVGHVLTHEAVDAIGMVSQACDANQTPLILTGEFGG